MGTVGEGLGKVRWRGLLCCRVYEGLMATQRQIRHVVNRIVKKRLTQTHRLGWSNGVQGEWSRAWLWYARRVTIAERRGERYSGREQVGEKRRAL